MKLINLGSEIGILKGDKYFLLDEVLKKLKINKKIYSILGFIKKINDKELNLIKNNLESEEINKYNLDFNKLYSPISKPKRNIICVGKNYYDHVKELEGQTSNIKGLPDNPIFFSKMPDKIIGNKDNIIIDDRLEVDYEVELAVIIGKEGKNIEKENVNDYIFGYSIFNDISDRNLQKKHDQWFLGKSVDSFSSMGPCIITKDEVDDPHNLDISLKINGEIRQSSNTSQMFYKISDLISLLSKHLTLKPGDIIATGTPSGVGMGFNPPKYLKAGDRVTCIIEKIGILENIVN
ncbi:MAG: fumarylacetoacetate hydrolase family protein [Bacillota bacterium]